LNNDIGKSSLSFQLPLRQTTNLKITFGEKPIGYWKTTWNLQVLV